MNVYVDGLAASIASVIAMAGDTIHMPTNAMMMIHHPMSGVYGNANEKPFFPERKNDVLERRVYFLMALNAGMNKTLSTRSR